MASTQTPPPADEPSDLDNLYERVHSTSDMTLAKLTGFFIELLEIAIAAEDEQEDT